MTHCIALLDVVGYGITNSIMGCINYLTILLTTIFLAVILMNVLVPLSEKLHDTQDNDTLFNG
jgi:hypothetical protein